MSFSDFFTKHKSRKSNEKKSSSLLPDIDGSEKKRHNTNRKRRRQQKPDGTEKYHRRASASDNADAGDDGLGSSVVQTKQMARPSNKKKKTSNSRRNQPTEEALALSERLKELSRQKNLDDALRIFWDTDNDKIRDGHHACIVIDACARSGRISEGEVVIDKMKSSGISVNVETKTALLKGYCHSGQIGKAESLFESMCKAQGKYDRPNVRTLNTLLRGCLWSATTVDREGKLYGGVETAERAWDLFKSMPGSKVGPMTFDISSYEYTVSLLCLALRVDDSEARIENMKRLLSDSDEDKEGNNQQQVSEALSMSYLALSRAYSTLGDSEKAINACQMALKFQKLSLDALRKAVNDPSHRAGKSAWRADNAAADSKRSISNRLFREHRLTEVELEASAILEACRTHRSDIVITPRQLARRLLTRFIVLSGGGTTCDEDRNSNNKTTNDTIETDTGIVTTEQQKEFSKVTQWQITNTAFFSFGLSTVAKTLDIPVGAGGSFLRRRDCNRLLGSVGLQGGIVNNDGTIDFARVFSAQVSETTGNSNDNNSGGSNSKRKRRTKSKPRPLEIELGSGYGDWIVKKAKDDPSRSFISVELRSDRVGQTFARVATLAHCTPIDNLCVVGAEGGSFLLERVKGKSIHTIYINHPEPPTQTFGADESGLKSIMDGDDEPAHMLCSKNLMAAAQCLKVTEGRLVIVTDNKWYAQLICATLTKMNRQRGNLLSPVNLAKLDGRFQLIDEKMGTPFFEGQPNETIGHSSSAKPGSEGESYFDRLWRSGAGTHAERHRRFIILMSRQTGQANNELS